MERNSKKKWGFLLVTLFVIGITVLFVRPAILGYGVYRSIDKSNYTLEELGQNVRNLQFELLASQANLSVQSGLTNELFGKFGGLADQLTACQEEKSDQASKLLDCEQRKRWLADELDAEENTDSAELTACTAALQDKDRLLAEKDQKLAAGNSECQQKLSSLQAEYDMLVKNTAKSICCKERVDNTRISSYAVLGGKVMCLEEGGTALVC